MTGAPALVPALAAALAGYLALAPQPRLDRSPVVTGVGAEVGALQRHRLALSLLTVVGVAAFVGGPVGLGAGLLGGGFAWRTLGRLESPAVVRRRVRLEHDLPAAIDLLVAALGSGAAPGPALGIVGTAVGGPVGDEFGLLHRRLALGADPAEVWADLVPHPQLGPLGRALGRAHETGASVTSAAERLCAELRERSRTAVETRARSVSTKAAAPLGACFLPAFVLLGIVPLVAGLVRSMGLLG